MTPNPIRTYVEGHELKEFTYSPGLYPFNFMPLDCGLSDFAESNILLWADDAYHATQLVIEMLRWFLDQNHDTQGSPCLETRLTSRLQRVQHWYDNKHLIKCVPAPTNQMYKISWADNDTFI